MGGDGRRRRGGARGQPGDDRARPSQYGAGDHGHDGHAWAGCPPWRTEHLHARMHAVSELQHGRSRTRQRHALHAGIAVRRGQAAGRQIASAYPARAGGRRHSDRVPYRPDSAYHRHVRRLQDSRPHRGCGHEDPGGRAGDRRCRLLHAGIRGRAGQDRAADIASSSRSRPSALAPAPAAMGRSCCATICSACSPISSRNSPSVTPN